MMRRLFGRRDDGDDFGPVCPHCKRYDWPTMPVQSAPCRSGVHRAKRCSTCDHLEVRYDCEGHG